MPRGIIDALYWRLHTAYLRNDREGATKFLSMLEDELKGDTSLILEIGPHVYRYKRISEEITSGRFGSLHGGYPTPLDSLPIYCEPTCNEREFHKTIMTEEASRALYAILGIPPRNAVMLHEAELGDYGRCDFFIRFDRKVVLIEVKMGEAPIYVSAQIEKYRTASELDMHLGLHDEVIACVMSESFGTYVSQKLSEAGVIMIKHCNSSNGFQLVGGR